MINGRRPQSRKFNHTANAAFLGESSPFNWNPPSCCIEATIFGLQAVIQLQQMVDPSAALGKKKPRPEAGQTPIYNFDLAAAVAALTTVASLAATAAST